MNTSKVHSAHMADLCVGLTYCNTLHRLPAGPAEHKRYGDKQYDWLYSQSRVETPCEGRFG